MSEFYNAESARGVRWDDPAFQIEWPAEVKVISERDRTYPNFEPRAMRLLKELDQRNTDEIGKELHSFAAELYPICRSITGDGLRRTLALIQKRIPLENTRGTNGNRSS